MAQAKAPVWITKDCEQRSAFARSIDALFLAGHMPNDSAHTLPDTSGDGYSLQRRFKRVEKLVEPQNLPLGGERIEEEKKKEAEVKALVKLKMNWEQIMRMLQTRGYKAARSTTYNLINKVKPRSYKPSKHAQSHHVFFTNEMIVRLTEDAAPERTKNIRRDQSPEKGARFKYDGYLKINGHRYYLEMQLSDIAGTDWSKKMRNYIAWYEKKSKQKWPFRVLFVIDQKGDISGVRARCREALEKSGHEKLNLFLFLPLDELKAQRVNLVYDNVWYTKDGNRIPLLNSKR